MERNDVKEWLRYHDAAFPGFGQWFEQVDSVHALDARMTLWHNRLAQFRVEQIKAQTAAMFDAADKPRYFSEHLEWICNRLRPRPLLNDGANLTTLKRCGLCNDTGLVTVRYHKQRYTPMGCPLPGNTGAVACKCDKGTWLNDGRSKHPDGQPLDVYTPVEMDLPQPVQLSDTERRAIEQRLYHRSPNLAAAVKRILRRPNT